MRRDGRPGSHGADGAGRQDRKELFASCASLGPTLAAGDCAMVIGAPKSVKTIGPETLVAGPLFVDHFIRVLFATLRRRMLAGRARRRFGRRRCGLCHGGRHRCGGGGGAGFTAGVAAAHEAEVARLRPASAAAVAEERGFRRRRTVRRGRRGLHHSRCLRAWRRWRRWRGLLHSGRWSAAGVAVGLAARRRAYEVAGGRNEVRRPTAVCELPVPRRECRVHAVRHSATRPEPSAALPAGQRGHPELAAPPRRAAASRRPE